MGTDLSTSVVNADSRTHQVENLDITVGLRNGGDSNPTLTIVALAHRLADTLKRGTSPEKTAMNSYPRREFLLRALAACGTPLLMPLASVEGHQKPRAGAAAAGYFGVRVRRAARTILVEAYVRQLGLDTSAGSIRKASMSALEIIQRAHQRRCHRRAGSCGTSRFPAGTIGAARRLDYLPHGSGSLRPHSPSGDELTQSAETRVHRLKSIAQPD